MSAANLVDKIIRAHTVDVIVRKDGVETRLDGGLLKEILGFRSSSHDSGSSGGSDSSGGGGDFGGGGASWDF